MYGRGMASRRLGAGASVLSLGLLAGCGGPPPRPHPLAVTAAPCASGRAPSVDAEPAGTTGLVDGPGAVASCPARSVEAAPGVHVVRTTAAAQALLEGVARPPSERLDLAALRKEKGPAFFVDVPGPFVHGAHVRHLRLAAVFVDGPRTVVVPRLADATTALPGSCGAERPTGAVAARVLAVKGAGKRGGYAIGHLRVLRGGVADVPTLPPPPDPADDEGRRARTCRALERFRVEDHFVRLDTGDVVLSVAQAFEAARYGAAFDPLPGTPFDAFAVDAPESADDVGGVSAGACRYRFDD